MHAWSFVGNFVCDSVREKGAKVIFMSFSAAMKYVDDAYDAAMTVVTSDRLAWLRDRDWCTRERMTELMRPPYKYPACEALDKALDEYRNSWEVGTLKSVDEDGKEVRRQVAVRDDDDDDTQARRGEKRRKDEGDGKSSEFCRAFNQGKCKGAKCPNKRQHRCDFVTKDGNRCGGFHAREIYHSKSLSGAKGSR
jgi:hypothetical protein